MEKIVLLGVSGSIGLQSIDVIKKFKNKFDLIGVSLSSNIDVLDRILLEFPNLKQVGIATEAKAEAFKLKHSDIQVFSGVNCSLDVIKNSDCDGVINALVGFAGLLPSLVSLQLKKRLMLANKESLVIGGRLIEKALKDNKGIIYPIDSEHSALAKCVRSLKREEIDSLLITASGGSLRDLPLKEVENASLEKVLHHPSWKMGKRITVDSATMINKAFEVIEASYIFNYPLEKIKVVINDESLFHAGAITKDGSLVLEAGVNDMRIPISYALNNFKREDIGIPFSLDSLLNLHFRKFDHNRYPLFSLALEAFKKGDGSICFFNAVDETLISYFVNKTISFKTYLSLMKELMSLSQFENCTSYAELLEIDKKAREISKAKVQALLQEV
ncbi:MAG: 1-deoxy-D-xylulose-5-phosphate reductoisomerase [Firmicutes bacterium]|uniref:1-deoxy-D-xylulose 5-phosphate reductoisomerase n=1 Tax=Candidatus Scatoplasma merdavium TaxID=2840932 RepID=A0A9D9D798_9BACL|nr:1-deoxy-D-xylulose-5-phosphate reductoisomerase [Candidatus Scatoplasma merdavium]